MTGILPRRRRLLIAVALVALIIGPAPAATLAEIEALLPDFEIIPAGRFVMGSPPTEPESKQDEAQYQVWLTRSFRLASTEVTQALWEAVMGENPSYFVNCPECPVDRVNWYDALTFCNRLSRLEGFVPAYGLEGDQVLWNHHADGYRLPTEAEWEYACRAGTTTAFHTGNCLDPELANFDGYRPLAGCPGGLNRGEPVAVGRLPANRWRLHDMHGNLAEWCWDRYGPYPAGETTDPRGPDAGPLRLVRGGCWQNSGQGCRSANRQTMPPDRRLDMIGLRLARTGAP